MKGKMIVGHVPRKISAACSLFLDKDTTITCTITGKRCYSSDLPQAGLEVPCVLHLQGRIKDIGKIVKLLCPNLPPNKKRKIDMSDPEAKCSEPHDEYNHKS